MKNFPKIIFIGLLFFLLLFCLNQYAKATGRALEIDYPALPSGLKIETTDVGLPTYIKYIFHFSFLIIGFIIFGVLVYNGFQYLASAGSGDPNKLKEAIDGFLYASLGGLILLGSYLIFNTINPQLTTIKIENLPLLSPSISPGIYVCNYKADLNKIKTILTDYISDDINRKINAVKDIKKVMSSNKNSCMKLNYSGKFGEFNFSQGKTWFIVPSKKEGKYINEYGVIVHEGDDFSGRCKLLSNLAPDAPYIAADFVSVGEAKFDNFNRARSFTLFQYKESEGEVTLYECPQYNDIPCKENVSKANLVSKNFKPQKYVDFVQEEDLGKDLKQNVRSIKIDPPGVFVALFENANGNFTGKCEVISQNTINLEAHPIGRCGLGCAQFFNILTLGILNKIDNCGPCVNSMYVIKAQKL